MPKLWPVQGGTFTHVDHAITPTWATVELPILRAVIQAEIENTDYTATARAAVPDIDDRHFRRAVAGLSERLCKRA